MGEPKTRGPYELLTAHVNVGAGATDRLHAIYFAVNKRTASRARAAAGDLSLAVGDQACFRRARARFPAHTRECPNPGRERQRFGSERGGVLFDGGGGAASGAVNFPSP